MLRMAAAVWILEPQLSSGLALLARSLHADYGHCDWSTPSMVRWHACILGGVLRVSNERACTAPRRALSAQTLAVCTHAGFTLPTMLNGGDNPNTGTWPAWPGPCILLVPGLDRLFRWGPARASMMGARKFGGAQQSGKDETPGDSAAGAARPCLCSTRAAPSECYLTFYRSCFNLGVFWSSCKRML